MKVKVCGITSQQDADAAIEAGADALGFIFYRASPRYIRPVDAGRIVRTMPVNLMPVGVFVNAPPEEILHIVNGIGLGCVQLHGDEQPEQTRGYPVPVWKAFSVRPDFNVSQLQRFSVAAYLLDTYTEGLRGGTGRIFDWRIAQDAKRFGRIVLSGGITPENVLEAVRSVHPYAIDVNSGVESSAGRKDKQKLQRLFTNINSERGSACSS